MDAHVHDPKHVNHHLDVFGVLEHLSWSRTNTLIKTKQGLNCETETLTYRELVRIQAEGHKTKRFPKFGRLAMSSDF